MGTIASQITSLTIVFSTVYSDAYQRKHQSFASLAFVRGMHRGPVNSLAQMASNAENVSIWWRHHVSGAKLLDESTDILCAMAALSLDMLVLYYTISMSVSVTINSLSPSDGYLSSINQIIFSSDNGLTPNNTKPVDLWIGQVGMGRDLGKIYIKIQ